MTSDSSPQRARCRVFIMSSNSDLWSGSCGAVIMRSIFLKNIHKRHPITPPSGRGLGCLLWMQHLNDILPQSLQLFMQCLTILNRFVTALDCIYDIVAYGTTL